MRAEVSFFLRGVPSRDEKIFVIHEYFHPGIPRRKLSGGFDFVKVVN